MSVTYLVTQVRNIYIVEAYSFYKVSIIQGIVQWQVTVADAVVRHGFYIVQQGLFVHGSPVMVCLCTEVP